MSRRRCYISVTLCVIKQDTRQEHRLTKLAAAATFCVYQTIRSGKVIGLLLLTRNPREKLPDLNTKYQDLFVMSYSRKATTAVIRCTITRRRVQSATWAVGQQPSWFQQEHSVRTTGTLSTRDICFPHIPDILDERSYITAPATFVWTRHRRLQLEELRKTKLWSTLYKSAVVHCHVQSIPLAERWPVSFALSDILGKTRLQK